jgi:hypothetical protein
LTPVLNDEYTDVDFAVYALKAGQLPLRLLTRQAEALRQDLLHVAGVKRVNILGERPEGWRPFRRPTRWRRAMAVLRVVTE